MSAAPEEHDGDLFERLVKLAREVAEIGSAGCSFWACEGPDPEPLSMKTCHCCWAVHDARALLRDVGVQQ